MPGGVPVATMAIGKGGAVNAGILAAEILAISDGRLRKKLVAYRRRLEKQVVEKDRKMNRERRKAS